MPVAKDRLKPKMVAPAPADDLDAMFEGEGAKAIREMLNMPIAYAGAYSGVVDAAQVEAKVAKLPAAAPAPEAADGPRKRVSLFGKTYASSTNADWTHCEGAGWVHRAERESFSTYYRQCALTKRWDKIETMVNGSGGTTILKTEADARGYVQCESSSYWLPKEEVTEALHYETGKPVYISLVRIREYGLVKCDVLGDRFMPGTPLTRIKGSERYQKVTPYALKSSNLFTQCPDCMGWFEKAVVEERVQFGGALMCGACYANKRKEGVIQAHNAKANLKPIYLPHYRLGHKEDGGVVFATHQRVKTPMHVRTFGVECETEMDMAGMKALGLTRIDAALQIVEALGEDFVAIKEDGTLRMNGKYSGPGLDPETAQQVDPNGTGIMYAGFEVVSCPADLTTHRKRWSKLDSIKCFKALRAWDTESCGLHVHVGKDDLGTLQIGRILEFINHPANLLFVNKVSGRSSGRWWKYVQRKASDALRPSSVVSPDEKAGGANRMRRVALNLNTGGGGAGPGPTIEFRMFRGSVNPRRILRCIEFTDALCEFMAPGNRPLSEGRGLDGKLLDAATYPAFISFVDRNRKRWPLFAEWLASQSFIAAPKIGDKTDIAKLTINPAQCPEAELRASPEVTHAINPVAVPGIARDGAGAKPKLRGAGGLRVVIDEMAYKAGGYMPAAAPEPAPNPPMGDIVLNEIRAGWGEVPVVRPLWAENRFLRADEYEPMRDAEAAVDKAEGPF